MVRREISSPHRVLPRRGVILVACGLLLAALVPSIRGRWQGQDNLTANRQAASAASRDEAGRVPNEQGDAEVDTPGTQTPQEVGPPVRQVLSITGYVVVDASGEFREGAEVDITMPERPWVVLASGASASDGRFTLSFEATRDQHPGGRGVDVSSGRAGPASYQILARVPADGLESVPVLCEAVTAGREPERQVLLRLRPTGILSGTVRGTDGSPLEDSEILIHSFPSESTPWNPGAGTSHYYRTASGPGGHFRLACRPGKALVFARCRDGPFGESIEALVSAGEKTEVEVEVGDARVRRIRLRAATPDGRGIANASIRLPVEHAGVRWMQEARGNDRHHARSGEDGLLDVWLPPFSSPISCALGAPGFEVIELLLPGTGGDGEVHEVRLMRGDPLRIHLVDPRTGLPPVGEIEWSLTRDPEPDEMADGRNWRIASIPGGGNGTPPRGGSHRVHPVTLLESALRSDSGGVVAVGPGEYAAWLPCGGEYDLAATISGAKKVGTRIRREAGESGGEVTLELSGGQYWAVSMVPVPVESPGWRALTDEELHQTFVWPLKAGEAGPLFPGTSGEHERLVRSGVRPTTLPKDPAGLRKIPLPPGTAALAIGCMDAPWEGPLPGRSPNESGILEWEPPSVPRESASCRVTLTAGGRPLAMKGIPVSVRRRNVAVVLGSGRRRHHPHAQLTDAEGRTTFALDPGEYQFEYDRRISPGKSDWVTLAHGGAIEVDLPLR